MISNESRRWGDGPVLSSHRSGLDHFDLRIKGVVFGIDINAFDFALIGAHRR